MIQTQNAASLAADLLAAVRERAPGFITERDGGDWYLVAPDFSRLAEGFISRDDARRALLWLAGGELPRGWELHPGNALFAELDCRQGVPAILWIREIATALPLRLPDLIAPVA